MRRNTVKVYVTEPIHPIPLGRLQEKADVVKWDDPLINDWSQADAMIIRGAKVTRERMAQAPKLKAVGKHGVGYDTIDVAAAKDLGITVVYTPYANVESVAELAVGFMIDAARNIPAGFDMVRAGVKNIAPKELMGTELKGGVLGMVGLGQIGRRVAEILKLGFNMRVIGYDRYLDKAKFAEMNIERYETLEDMLAASDYINISVPLLPSTRNLIDVPQFACFKKTAVLVNTSRGGIVNEKALYDALASGKIRAAASDVFEQEPPLPDNPLLKLKNFLGTPHIGATTEESMIRVGNTVVDDILGILSGLAPQYPVK